MYIILHIEIEYTNNCTVQIKRFSNMVFVHFSIVPICALFVLFIFPLGTECKCCYFILVGPFLNNVTYFYCTSGMWQILKGQNKI